MALVPPRFKSSAILNRVSLIVARLQVGSAGRGVHLLQMALLDLGYAMPNSLPAIPYTAPMESMGRKPDGLLRSFRRIVAR